MTVSIGPGAFVAVVGASGVGKDTLLVAAHARCVDSVFFPRRAITRPPGPGEDHSPLTELEFATSRDRGDFAICWRAHGLDYAIPTSADHAIRAGHVVVANISRGILDDLSGRYERVVVVRITVSDDVRAARLRARHRETADDIARRLERKDPGRDHKVDYEISNDGAVEDASAELLRIIELHVDEQMGTA